MSETGSGPLWHVGDIVFQPSHGVVGKLAGFGELKDSKGTVESLKLESGDEFIRTGCVRGTYAQLQLHDNAVDMVGTLMRTLMTFAKSLELMPNTALLILAGVVRRQAMMLQGTTNHAYPVDTPNHKETEK
jgi:hypothetical protein